MPVIIVAIPTIRERGDAWEEMARLWRKHTCQPIIVEPSWRPGGWVQGLEEVWERHRDADVFVCGSDDFYPEGDFWLPPVLEHLERGECPVPTVLDPRMTTHGGREDSYWSTPIVEGAPADMTNFPILKGEWLSAVFPFPANYPQHYYADNMISDLLRAAGVPLVTCLDSRIIHKMDERGRGSGMGSETARMAHDKAIYRKLAPKH